MFLNFIVKVSTRTRLPRAHSLTCHSSLLIHNWWNVPRLARMLPPSQPPYLRSAGLPGAWILTCGKLRTSSLFRRSPRPAKRLPPPARTTLPMRTWRMSGSHAASACEISAGIVRGRCGFDALGGDTNFTSRLVRRGGGGTTHDEVARVCEEQLADLEAL